MRSRRLIAILAALSALAAGPVLAQFEGLGQTSANGCDVFVGRGFGQVLTPLAEFPMIDVGSLTLSDLGSGRVYTFVYEGISFPPIPTGVGSTVAYSGFGSWRFEQSGVQGTNRYRLLATPDDPIAPTNFALTLESEVIAGNRYGSGGSFLAGTLDAVTGSYSVDFFSIVLCRP